jgi:asparagine synthase (glutamine-hydrolysing)
MLASLRHRGPDGEGTWIPAEHPIGLAHTRLAIIDLDDRAAQPMASSDGRYVIVYNGEIYNYLELRQECEALGSRFCTQCDTEVVFEAYRHWGGDAFTKFTGMWAAVIYDQQQREAVFTRDPFAIKPLFYGWLDERLYFASEIKALIAADRRFAEVDETSVLLFEQHGLLDRGEWTFFRRVKRFPHAHYAVVPVAGTERLRPQRYWNAPETQPISQSDAVERLADLLKQSIKLHLRSDVPVGACLSGGLDSSAIVCVGAQELGEADRFNTFTTRFPEHADIDETSWADQVIEKTNVNPHYAEPTFQFFMEQFDAVLASQDEPFGSTSIFSQAAIYRRVAETDVKVLLNGQGADELFAGYQGCIDVYLKCLMESFRWWTFLRELVSARRLHGRPRHIPWRPAIGRLGRRLLRQNSPDAQADPAGDDEALTRLESLDSDAKNFEKWLNNLVCEDNLPQLLRYEDRNSMAASVESRVPYLEVELVNFALSLPADLKINRGQTKFVLREALRDVVPDRVRCRVDKLGFPAPEQTWLARGFGITDTTVGGQAWRTLITRRWRESLKCGRPD